MFTNGYTLLSSGRRSLGGNDHYVRSVATSQLGQGSHVDLVVFSFSRRIAGRLAHVPGHRRAGRRQGRQGRHAGAGGGGRTPAKQDMWLLPAYV